MSHSSTVPSFAALPPPEVCQQARLSRDVRFEGRFYVAVLSTGIFCRPTCPARIPRESNVRYYPSAGAALEAGYRPCRRCRPESAPGLPEWTVGSAMVLRGLRQIEAGYLNQHSTAELAAELGVGERQLTRVFSRELGAAPRTIAQLVRANLARQLLCGTGLRHAEVAFHAGYRSLSRFNAEIRRVFRCPPGALRSGRGTAAATSLRMQLPVREPYDFDWIFSYLQARALHGLEEVGGGPGNWFYQRLVPAAQADGDQALRAVRVEQRQGGLSVVLPIDGEPLHRLLQRVRRVFDLQADGATIHEFLAQDAQLSAVVAGAPGLRVPGAWDGFETAVRAVLGQQVSVARGTVLANAMIARFGAGLFPTPQQLMHQDVAQLGMPGRRGRAIAELASAVHAGVLQLDDVQDFDRLQAQLQAIDGIGPWTANYIRMRVAKDPDAFPDNDWVVLKQLECSAAQARKKAQGWRPWRAYALMYVWYEAGLRRAAVNTGARPATVSGSKG